MIGRIIIIARNTLLEAVRQKVLNVLLLFGVVMISVSTYFSQIEIGQQIKFVKDFGTGLIGWIGAAIAILSVAQLLPSEMHNRTIYTILAKPVRRAEFLLGKFGGVVLLLTLCVALMTLAFGGVLWWQEHVGLEQVRAEYEHTPGWGKVPETMNMYQNDVQRIEAQVRDPQLIRAMVLIYAKIIMAAAMAMLISTFSTSFIFTVVTATLLYIIGHMESTARDVWLSHGANAGVLQSGFLEILALLVPDMNSFTIVDEILDGHVVPWRHTLELTGYAGIYTFILLAISDLIFEFREV